MKSFIFITNWYLLFIFSAHFQNSPHSLHLIILWVLFLLLFRRTCVRLYCTVIMDLRNVSVVVGLIYQWLSIFWFCISFSLFLYSHTKDVNIFASPRWEEQTSVKVCMFFFIFLFLFLYIFQTGFIWIYCNAKFPLRTDFFQDKKQQQQ